MAQYSTGTVSTTGASQTVTGSGTSWSSNVSQGDEILFQGDAIFYVVASVDSDTQITLQTPYYATRSTITYVVNRDFTTGFNLPKPKQGDAQIVNTVARALEKIDANLGFGGLNLGTIQDNNIADPSTITLGAAQDGLKWIVASAGAVGDWAGEEDNVATYDHDTTSWSFQTATDGMYGFVLERATATENNLWYFATDTWVEWETSVNTTGMVQYNATLADNTASATVVDTTHTVWPEANTYGVKIDYNLERSTSFEQGTLHISLDNTGGGSSEDISRSFSFTDVGATFTVDINSSNLRLLYTTTSTGSAITMRYFITIFKKKA